MWCQRFASKTTVPTARSWVLLKPRQVGLFRFTLKKHRSGRLFETVRFSVLYSEARERKEDVQAGQVRERHDADVTSWRSGWQPWKGNILYRLATAFVGSTSLEKVPPPSFTCISLSVGVLFQESSRAKVLKVQCLKENCCFRDKITIGLNAGSFHVSMYVLPVLREWRRSTRGENGRSWE